MNFFNLIQQTVLTKYSIHLNTWSDFNPLVYEKVALELNNCLQDTWLNFNYLFKERQIAMTTVIGQYNYDLPANGFTGKIKQDGLMIQPVTTNMLNQPASFQKLRYNYNTEMFFSQGLPNQVSQNPQQGTIYGTPRFYTTFNNEVLLKPIPDKAYNMICLYYCRNWALSNASVVTGTAPQNQSGQKILAVDHTQDVDVYGNTQPVFAIGDVLYINKDTNSTETGTIQSIDTVNNLIILVGNLTFTHTAGCTVSVERQIMQFATDTPNCEKTYHNVFVAGALAALFYGDSRQQIYDSQYKKRISNMVNESKNSQDGQEAIRITHVTW
jgi:hypothetical protein